jgi:NAD(P)-dependent dehydrogenase (short-subunit alcohol dehydrogenase family)
MPLTLDLTDRVVLVTGGTRGVGLGITRVFLAAGATVVTCSRTEDVGVEGADHRVCDVRDGDSVEALVAGIVADHGRFDVLVNNAGGAPYVPAADASPRFHSKIVELNLLSPLLVAQAANSVMQGQDAGGVIVNISSLSALRPSPGTAAYGAAKAGVDSLTRSLAVEWAPKVRVNAIDVGMVRTEQTDDHYGGDEGVARIEATIPLGRMADPADVGHVAAFLASDLAAYVSGASIECHGGGEPPLFLSVQNAPTPKENR